MTNHLSQAASTPLRSMGLVALRVPAILGLAHLLGRQGASLMGKAPAEAFFGGIKGLQGTSQTRRGVETVEHRIVTPNFRSSPALAPIFTTLPTSRSCGLICKEGLYAHSTGCPED